VAVAGRREAPLKQAIAEAGAQRVMTHHVCDVTQRPDVAQLVRDVTDRHGPIDILVCAAGINIKTRSMSEMTPDQWDQVMQINATGTYNVLYHALPEMRRRKRGLVINLSSIAGKRAIALGGIAYCASKFAVTALGTAVGTEVATDGIRVTNVYPGEVDTPILQQRPTPVSDEHRQRILKPQDVADLVLAICQLPERAHVPEVVIKPVWQSFV
jgi:NADP-dependent 3-hydroxy acid dehydrogenase YdfG